MKTIVISISVPDGVEFHVTSGPPPDDFEHEPLPDPQRFGPDAELPPSSNGYTNPGNATITEPASLRRDTMAAPVPVPAAVATIWQPGQSHVEGHKPLKPGKYGLYCPTAIGKDASGKTLFCQWRP